jgi:hypothetical protein
MPTSDGDLARARRDGRARGRQHVDPDAWYFKAHFHAIRCSPDRSASAMLGCWKSWP